MVVTGQVNGRLEKADWVYTGTSGCLMKNDMSNF